MRCPSWPDGCRPPQTYFWGCYRDGMPDGPTATFVPVTLREPPPAVRWGADALRMSGLELMRAVRDQRLPEPPISMLTGLRATDVGLGKTTFAMPASPWVAVGGWRLPRWDARIRGGCAAWLRDSDQRATGYRSFHL